jgi:uncharacterized protein YabE (DUF348 family)
VIWPDPTTPVKNGMTISVRKAFAVAVEADGAVHHVRTQQSDPLAILTEQHIQVGEYDVVRVDGQDFSTKDLQGHTWDSPPSNICVLRSSTLNVTDDGQTLVIHTTQTDVGRALDAAGIKLYLADSVTPDFSAPVKDGLTISIQRSHPITLAADGRHLATRAHGPTVGDALAAIGMAPVGQDYTIPPADAPLESGMTIQVVRVTEKLLTEQESIPFQTLYQPDTSLELDKQQTLQEGKEGLRERHIHVRYEDGLEVSRIVQDERVANSPVPQLIGYGTQVKVHRLDTPGGPIEYWRKIQMRVTAYSPSRSGLSPDSPGYGLTTTGMALTQGIVAVDPDLIPLFSSVYVPGYGHATAGDARTDIQGRMIALGYTDDSWQPWYGWVDVYLLTPAPSADHILYLLPSE